MPRGCRDFEDLALRDYKRLGKTYGLEKFWAFHHYHGLPEGCKLAMNAEVRRAAPLLSHVSTVHAVHSAARLAAEPLVRCLMVRAREVICTACGR